MAKYYVGTAGWSYEDWDGIVYPVRKGAGFHALSFLADFIDIVEVNSTFYRPAPPAMVRSWLKRIEDRPDFMLALKLYQGFTHAGEGFTKKDVEEVRLAADLVHLQGRLAALLVQFPWSFRNTSENTAYLERLLSSSPGCPCPSRSVTRAGTRPPSTTSSARAGPLSATSTSRCSRDRSSLRPSARTRISLTSASTAATTRTGSARTPDATTATTTSTPRASSMTGSRASRTWARRAARSTSSPTTITVGRPWPTPSRSGT